MRYGYGNIFESNLERVDRDNEIGGLESFKKAKDVIFVIKDITYRKNRIIWGFDDFNYF